MSSERSNELARAMFDEAGDALFLFDPDSDRLVDVNATAERLTGLPREELLARPASYWFRFGGPGGTQRLRQAANKSGVFHAQDGFLLRTGRDGEWVPVNLTIARLHVAPRPLALATARDVRDRVEAQARLAEAEAELRSVLASASDCLWSAAVDAVGRWTYRYVSPAAEWILGRTPDELREGLHRWREVVHPADRPRWDRAVARLRGGEPVQEEYRVLRPDGGERRVRDHVAVRRQPDGTLRLVGTLTDLTELRLLEEDLDSFFALSLDMLCIAGFDGYFKRLNPAWERTLGYTIPELLAQPFLAFVHPDDRAATLTEYERLQGGANTVAFENRYRCKDGSYRWLSWSATPLRDRQRIFAAARDTTERRRVAQELRRTKESAEASAHWTRQIVDTAYDAFVAMDSAGRITDWNRQAELTFGWPRAEALGRVLAETIIPPESREAHARGLAHFLATGEGPVLGRRVEVVALRRDGSRFPAELTISPIRLGDSWAFSAFVQDISARKHAEEELRRAKEAAEAASKAKSEFLANMSHEIRTPMNGVLGMTELALQTDLTDEQREYLEMARLSAEALLAVINDVLDFSKIEARKLQLDAVPFDLRDTLGDAARAVAVRAQEKGLELAWHAHPDVPATVVGDPGRLRQVLVNLVGNAIKFTERGEVVVEVRVASCELRVASESDPLATRNSQLEALLHFSVRDTGIGIPPDKRERIFEAFAQADASTTRRYGGTGLGLTISSQLVALMGGRLWLESEVGRGSTFHFTARLGLPQPGEVPPPAAPPADVRGVPVLVVDDNATNRRILRELLAGWGMRPTVVDGGAAALAAVRAAAAAGEPFPLLLLDGHMPGMDGFAVAAELRRDPTLADTAVVMLTSAGLPGDAARCRELGLRAHLMKPVKPSDLLAVLRRVVGGVAPAEPVPEPAAAGPRGLRVLVAEDHPVNQRLVLHLLQKHGHTVEVVATGRAALEALERRSFDLVLMDVQMPEVDGLEATARLRRREAALGRRTPVIALTAHAMKGDRERCLEAGMDAYVAKPIQARDLYAAIARVVPTGVSAVDSAAALAAVAGDAQLLRELAGLFLTSSAGQLAELRAAVARRDAAAVRRLAHTLRGAVGLFGAPAVCAAAERLEAMARAGDFTEADVACDELTAAVDRLRPALTALAADGERGRERREERG